MSQTRKRKNSTSIPRTRLGSEVPAGGSDGVTIAPLSPPSWVLPVIAPEHLEVLKQYKYTGSDLSILVELFFRQYWDWCITFWPMWIAPNIITTIGFCCLILNFTVGVHLCPSGAGCDVPSWYFYMCALNLFLYQLLDNLDGRQARRTGASGPLGELFDHGCDSLFLLLTSIPLLLALGLPPYNGTIMLLCGLLVFYTAHWEEYHSNHLILGRYANPTEVQIFMIGLFLFAGAIGPSFFEHQVGDIVPFSVPPMIGLRTLGNYVFLFTICGCLYGVLDNAVQLVWWSKKENYPFLRVCTRFVPFAAHVVLMFAYGSATRINVIEMYTVKFLLLTGLVASLLTDHLMVSRITKNPVGSWSNLLLVSLIGLANSSMNIPLIDELLLLNILLALVSVYYVAYIISIIFQLSYYLNIHVFTIPYEEED